MIARFFGIPFDVRHVTLSTGTLALAAARFGTSSFGHDWFYYAMAGIGVTFVLNLGVSFSIAVVCRPARLRCRPPRTALAAPLSLPADRSLPAQIPFPGGTRRPAGLNPQPPCRKRNSQDDPKICPAGQEKFQSGCGRIPLRKLGLDLFCIRARLQSGRTGWKKNWASAPCTCRLSPAKRQKRGGYRSVPRGLKPSSTLPFTARLKPCPDTKHESIDYRKTRAFRGFDHTRSPLCSLIWRVAWPGAYRSARR